MFTRIPALTLLTLLTLSALMCSCGEPPRLVPVDPDASSGSGCRFDDVTVLPADGAGPLHRTTPLVVSWRGNADVVIELSSGGARVPGETWADDGRALHLPLGVLPASSLIEWSVTGCNVSKRGAFATGEILRPLEDVGECVGMPQSLDLRAATLTAPVSGSSVGDVILKWRLAPVMFLMATSVEYDDANEASAAAFALVPGTLDVLGLPRPDRSQPAQYVYGSLADNPYVSLQPKDFPVSLDDGVIQLRDVELILGLGPSGFEDGRIVAVVDTRDMPQAADPCGVIETMTSEKCFPCDARDEAASCFLLEMEDMRGLPFDGVLLPPMPPTPPGTEATRACDENAGTGCPASSMSIGAPTHPAPIEPRWPCPEGALCPERPAPLPPPN